MKISERHLRRIIREELERAWLPYGTHGDDDERLGHDTDPELEEADEAGPSPASARKMIRGKSWKEKVRSTSEWADDPEAAAAWLTHRATGKWPRED